MENNKQVTAVEFLVDNLHYLHSTKWYDILEQAKAIEKEQIIETYIEASENPALILDDAEQYYNETYGK